MDKSQWKGFSHVGLRKHLVDAFVCDVYVGFADLHRPQKIKTPLNFQLWQVIE